ncbi:acyltransferase family protein [Nakamurella leprariae]|uniref:Acyltransferase family protein n=1 Tax=Nakamurella leprariae TaxID=2803911 RepID=A0A939BY26_9ACTN|nr:acyltransferase family protein [Nakamurella leprariae]MBM9466630.1 acyltransferase family protein [Nakamurella leprariae]
MVDHRSSGHRTPAPVEPSVAPATRNPYADFLRAFSLLVVIMWHWCFTILVWNDEGPYATSPLGFTSGLWIFTWLLQVMPVFFGIGAYVHLKAWERAAARGERIWHFALRQARSLVLPSALLLLTWLVLGVIVGVVFDVGWIGRAVLMVVSPLWFVAAYSLFVVLMPVTVWLHRRYDSVVLVVMGGLAVVVDLLRFRYQVPGIEWANMIFVWGFAFQLGYFYERFTGLGQVQARADGSIDWSQQTPKARQTAVMFTLAGLFALIGLVFSGLYPGSMVGVPGELSNMAPPTVCIIALTIFQFGIAELIRPSVVRALQHGGLFSRVTKVFTLFALPLFLFHTTGMALSRAIEWTVLGSRTEIITPTLGWWLLRPLAVVGPLLCTLPVIYLFVWLNKRHLARRGRS